MLYKVNYSVSKLKENQILLFLCYYLLMMGSVGCRLSVEQRKLTKEEFMMTVTQFWAVYRLKVVVVLPAMFSIVLYA